MDNNKISVGLVVAGISIGAVLVLSLIYVFDAKPSSINVGPVEFQLPTVASITENSAPTTIGTVRIPGNTNQGVLINIEQSGHYTFEYVSGAYSTYALENISSGQESWLTTVHVFKSGKAQWVGEVVNHDAVFMSIAHTGFSSSSEESERVAEGMISQAYFDKGEAIVLIADDGRSFYSDNPGEVVLKLSVEPD